MTNIPLIEKLVEEFEQEWGKPEFRNLESILPFFTLRLEEVYKRGRQDATVQVENWLNEVGKNLGGQLQDFNVVNVQSLRRELEAAKQPPITET